MEVIFQFEVSFAGFGSQNLLVLLVGNFHVRDIG
jgi:hypothetical protein